jgi:hypothetical protein
MHPLSLRGGSPTHRPIVTHTLAGTAPVILYFLGGIGLHASVPMLAADAVSATTTGKAATDHALDAVSGKDCRVIEGASRADRRVCEDTGAQATARDLKGPIGQ